MTELSYLSIRQHDIPSVIYIVYMYILSHDRTAVRQVIVLLLTLGAHAQEGYGTCLVCLSACYHSSGDLVRFNAQSKVRGGLL